MPVNISVSKLANVLRSIIKLEEPKKKVARAML